MKNQVKIVKNAKSGQVFTPGTKVSKDGKSYGFYVVEESHISMENGFIREEKRNAILTVENTLGAKLAWSEGSFQTGKIVRTESSQEMFAGQKPVINPENSQIVMRNGSPLYRQDMYTEDLTKTDKLVSRDTTTANIEIAAEDKLAA